MTAAAAAVYIDLDDAWPEPGVERMALREWGPRVRFTAPAAEMEAFCSVVEPLSADFVLFGSGDFHHLTALWLRRIREPVTLVAFDNHPDWDLRPPRWACGGWINRALELPQVKRAVIWGCGNFECWWPHQIFGNRAAERAGRLVVHPWADDRAAKDQNRRGAILRQNWREQFISFAQQIADERVYVTIDLDCLSPGLAWTNWENGRFELDDVSWALAMLREQTRVVGGDLCGAYSEPQYARRAQRLAANWDHPRIDLPPGDIVSEVNRAALDALWPALRNTGL